MATDKALIEKREELKRRLTAGEYKTLVDIFLEWFERVLQKIMRSTVSISLWIITLILSIFVVAITLLATSIAGDLEKFSVVAGSFGLNPVFGYFLVISIVILTVSTVVVINQSFRRITYLWRDNILGATESTTSLDDFENWLKTASNIRAHLFVTIIGGLLSGYFVAQLVGSILGSFVGYGISFSIILVCLFLAGYGYQFLIVIILPVVLRRYALKLFSADPATSELLSRLSGELSFFVYFVAVYAALITLATVQQGIFQNNNLAIVLILWLPIIAVFALNQSSLSSIVRRAKWKTLNEIQTKVEDLQASENLQTKETMDAINRLLDYHERVNKKRTSALDLRAYLNFINSLLLPLLAFILGNFDFVKSLFIRQP